jgi:hypothetical protein
VEINSNREIAIIHHNFGSDICRLQFIRYVKTYTTYIAFTMYKSANLNCLQCVKACSTSCPVEDVRQNLRLNTRRFKRLIGIRGVCSGPEQVRMAWRHQLCLNLNNFVSLEAAIVTDFVTGLNVIFTYSNYNLSMEKKHHQELDVLS